MISASKLPSARWRRQKIILKVGYSHMIKTEAKCSAVLKTWQMLFQRCHRAARASEDCRGGAEEGQQRPPPKMMNRVIKAHLLSCHARGDTKRKQSFHHHFEKNKLPGNNQHSLLETRHASPSDRATRQVDTGEMRDVIFQTCVRLPILSLVTF